MQTEGGGNGLYRRIRDRRTHGDREKFHDRATLGDSVLLDLDATRVIDCWGDDVPDGKLADFRKAWMNNPEKADPRMDPAKNPILFDGKRLTFGGFAPLVEVAANRQSKEA